MSRPDLAQELGAPVDNGERILKIMAANIFSAPPTLESFQLCRHERRRRYDAGL